MKGYSYGFNYFNLNLHLLTNQYFIQKLNAGETGLEPILMVLKTMVLPIKLFS